MGTPTSRTKATTADAYRLIHDGAIALARAERQGIRLDLEYCEKKKEHLTRQINRLHKKLRDTKFYRRWHHIYGAKTNVYSNHQLANLLYNHMKIRPPKTTVTGRGSTDEDALSRIEIPELKLILQIRKLSKVRDTYLDAFIREHHDGRIHPSFNLHTVRTFRSSSDRPNFQNIPVRDKESMTLCRKGLRPRPGHQLMEMDFSAIEVHIAACYCKDPELIRYLQDKDSDMHLDMAKQIFIFDDLDRGLPIHNMLRQAAKNGFVFPQFYGDYYMNSALYLTDWTKLPQEGRWKKGVGIQLPDGQYISNHFIEHGIKSFDDFTEHVKRVEDDFWNSRFKYYNRWRRRQVEQYYKKGYLTMHTGFTCSGAMRRNEIMNYPIQGSAFHCLLYTFIELDRAMIREEWKSRLIGQIHDCIVVDAHPEEIDHVEETARRIIREDLPAKWPWIIIPLEIDVDRYEVDGPWIS